MSVLKLLAIMVSATFAQNFVLVKLLGICPFVTASEKSRTSIQMGAVTTVVMLVSTIITYPINKFILMPLGVEYMKTIIFLLIIAATVWVAEIAVRVKFAHIHRQIRELMPSALTNTAIFGVTLLATQGEFNFIEAAGYSLAAGIGFTIAMLLFSTLRERLKFTDCPKSFEGLPIAFVTVALVALAFMGFRGM